MPYLTPIKRTDFLHEQNLMKYIFFYQTAIGKIGIAEKNGSITDLYLEHDQIPDDANLHETEMIHLAGVQVTEYLSGVRKEFSLPLDPKGTPFMQTVWTALCAVPYGETRSYKEIAQTIGNPGACRAVGLANNRNPIPLFIPCHRIIGSDGGLTGYRGGLTVKSYLLELEKRYA